MAVLVPIDGSDCSVRALEFGVEFAERFDADLDVVHVTDHRTDATEKLVERANAVLAEAGMDQEVEIITDMRKFRASERVGKQILHLVEEEGYEHVVMGHHGTGVMGRALLGSAAETVLEESEIPVTTVP
jgi:nucleotide-binding universal stress UspA family protein